MCLLLVVLVAAGGAGAARAGSPAEDAPPGPYFIWKAADGSLVEGPLLPLKPRQVLLRIHDLLRPRQGPTRFVPRAGTDGAPAAAVARERLRAIAAAPESGGTQAVQARLYFDLLGKFGDASDLPWLLDAGYALDADSASRAAVEVELRLGRLADGAVIHAARERLATGGLRGWRGLLPTLLRVGLPEAFALAEQRRRQLVAAGDPYHGTGSYGLPELLLSPGTVPVAAVRDFLAALRAHVLQRMQAPGDYSSYALDQMAAYVAAVLYLAKHDPQGYGEAASMPIPLPRPWHKVFGAFRYEALGLIVATPELILDAFYTGLEGGEAVRSTQFWPRVFAPLVCHAGLYGTEAERKAAVDALIAQMAGIHRAHAYPDHASADPGRRKAIDMAMILGTEAGASECLLSDSLVGREIAPFLQDGVFVYLKAPPLLDWWLRPGHLPALMNGLHNIQDFEKFGPYAHDQVAAAVKAAGLDPGLAEAMLLHHRHLTAGFNGFEAPFTYGGERRSFRIQDRHAGEGSTAAVIGHVIAYPVAEDGRLYIGLRHRILSGDSGGLAAAMDAAARAPFETPGREAMFEHVRLEQDGRTTDAARVAVLDDGALVYAVPFDGDFGNAYLRLGMRYMDRRWTLDYALADSQAAFRARLEGD